MTDTTPSQLDEPRDYEPPTVVSLGLVERRTEAPIGSVSDDN